MLARSAGFSNLQSYQIAYSSQYVDDNTGDFEVSFHHRNHHRNKSYQSFPTAITNPFLDSAFCENVNMAFHFVPSPTESSALNRTDNASDNSVTVSGGSLVRSVLVTALKARDTYRIGIASHAFLDTWAHQNFTGKMAEFNSVTHDMHFKGFGTGYPKIGHIDVMLLPDLVGMEWYDYRLRHCLISNNKRFAEAIVKLYKLYCDYLDNNEDSELIQAILETWKLSDRSKRFVFYKDLFTKVSAGVLMIPYDRKYWLRRAVMRNGRGFCPFSEKTFEASDWYKFQEAAKLHYDFVREATQDYGIFAN